MKALSGQFAQNAFATPLAEESLPSRQTKTRILYGVQGTGNGHISRAGAMNKALSARGCFEVTWLMSGRPQQPIMCCDDYRWYRGMTFATRNGRVELLNTLAGNNVFEFFRDIREIGLDAFDLIITDFEPVVAWSARRQGRPCIGIGHQYAFYYPVPVARGNTLAKRIMRHFAPADTRVGLHWHHFDQPILPPIVDMHAVSLEQPLVPGKVLVYLPFENQDDLVQIFRSLPDWDFYLYSAEMEDYTIGNIHTRAISKTGFKNDLVTADAVITNSGFELISECLPLGKRILTRPLQGQVEQLSNACALAELGYATVADRIDRKTVGKWLDNPPQAWRVDYPDVAGAIADWLGKRAQVSVEDLAASLWQQTRVCKARRA